MLHAVFAAIVLLMISGVVYLFGIPFRAKYLEENAADETKEAKEADEDEDGGSGGEASDETVTDEKETITEKDGDASEDEKTEETEKKTEKSRRKKSVKERIPSVKECVSIVKKELSDSKKLCVFSIVLFVTASLFIGISGTHKGSYIVPMIQSLALFEIVFLIASIDKRIKKIPNKLILALLFIRLAGMATELIISPSKWMEILLGSFVGFLAAGAVMLLCMIVSRGGVGAGDMKLFALIGLYYQITGVLEIMLYSLFIASVVSIFLLVSRKAKAKSSIPMAPFICIGIAVYTFFIYA